MQNKKEAVKERCTHKKLMNNLFHVRQQILNKKDKKARRTGYENCNRALEELWPTLCSTCKHEYNKLMNK